MGVSTFDIRIGAPSTAPIVDVLVLAELMPVVDTPKVRHTSHHLSTLSIIRVRTVQKHHSTSDARHPVHYIQQYLVFRTILVLVCVSKSEAPAQYSSGTIPENLE